MREQLIQRRKQGLIILGECFLAREEIERRINLVRADLDAIDKALSIPEEKSHESPSPSTTP